MWPPLRRCVRSLLLATALGLIPGESALAGMPSITLADVRRVLVPTGGASMRLEVISCFVFGFLALAGLVRWIWNSLRRDFTSLPRHSYPRAFGRKDASSVREGGPSPKSTCPRPLARRGAWPGE